MGRIVAGILVLVLISVVSSGQTVKHYLEWGDENMAAGDAYGASLYYEKAMKLDSNNIDILWKYAESLRKYNNYKKAEWYYQKVYDRGRGKIHPMSVYWLAEMLKYNGNYRDSRKVWRRVGRYLGRDDEYYDDKADQESKSCNWARRMLNDSAGITVENMGDGVNSIASEFGPFFSSSDNELLFTSLRAKEMNDEFEVHDEFYTIKIYVASGETQYLRIKGELDSTINDHTTHNANPVLSPDQQRLYFTRCKEQGDCDIYISRKNEDGTWAKPDKIGGEINGSYSSTQPHIVEFEGKEYLFFASDMEGTYGGLDLWYSIVSKNGNRYSKPKNLGKKINTPDNEITPYYDTTENALYFSSTWHYGYGGQDIFKSAGSPNKPGPPENLGLPYNTSVNDMYFKKDPPNNRAFLTSNRIGSIYKKSPTCCNDIWVINYTTEKKDTVPYKSLEDLNKFLPVTLYFHNDRPGPNSLDTTINLNYLTTFQRYTAMTPDYKKEYSEGLSASDAAEAVEDIDDFFQEKVNQGVEDLEMFTGLLLAELEKGRKVEMTIQGFASPLAATAYNVNLTYRRISSLINYLREYEDGVMIPYLDGSAENGGSLSFVKIPKGEFTADQAHVSDNPNDTKNSVYSISAALERKIEIKSVQQANQKDSIYAEIHFNKEFHVFGVLPPNVTRDHTFSFRNTGNKDLTVDSLIADCECIEYDFQPVTLAPGESASFSVVFSTEGLEGFTEKTIIVKSNAVQGDKELSLTVEVKEGIKED